jgi:hypothetical protein
MKANTGAPRNQKVVGYGRAQEVELHAILEAHVLHVRPPRAVSSPALGPQAQRIDC